MIYTEQLTCRLCGSSALDTVLDLGQVPLTGVFPLPREPVAATPLHLARCHACGLTQLRHTVRHDVLYTETYGYRSGGNPSMVRHLNEVAVQAGSLRPVYEGEVVVDIGGNDGTLLNNYYGRAVTVNVEPLAEFNNWRTTAQLVVTKPWSAEVGEDLAANVGRAAHVFTLAMLYDIDDPLAFARQVRELLADDGLWVIEVQDADAVLERTVYDTICQEHVTYWSRDTLTGMLRAVGFQVRRQERTPTNGGSLLLFCEKVEPVDGSFYARDDGLSWRYFAARVLLHRRWLSDVLDPRRKLYGLGASTRGNTVLHNCALDHHRLVAIGETNTQKYGRVTPVGRVPIVSQAEALEQADDLLVLPWHFRPFFEETLRPRLRPGQRLIFPLPF